jgi:uncharacterized protein (TIGR02145 family)
VMGAVCVSCGQTRPAALVGQWVSLNGRTTMELFKDGTGSVNGRGISWKTEGKRFVLSGSGGTILFDYNLSGYEFKLTGYNGTVEMYVRKDKVEEYNKKKAAEAKKEEERRKAEAERKQKEDAPRIEALSKYIIDSRDGQKYRIVKIGDKVWMAQNMNYQPQSGKSWCYGDNPDNCAKYGRLYDWETAKTACLSGSHLPSRDEWNELVSAAGGKEQAGKALKSTFGWKVNTGTDDFGFSALPGGRRNDDGGFINDGYTSTWWTAAEEESNAYNRSIGLYGDDTVSEGYDYKGLGFSARCVKDE